MPTPPPEGLGLGEGDRLGLTLGLGEGDGLGLRDGEGLGLGDAEGETLGLGDGDRLGLTLGLGDGGVPLALVNTTIPSAGTETELPEKVLVAIVGLAALYTYWVCWAPVMPRLAVLTERALDGFALASRTAYPPPGRLA